MMHLNLSDLNNSHYLNLETFKNMSCIAERLYSKCMLEDVPSNALDRDAWEFNHTRNQRWDDETTTYIFEDGSLINDCNGDLFWQNI